MCVHHEDVSSLEGHVRNTSKTETKIDTKKDCSLIFFFFFLIDFSSSIYIIIIFYFLLLYFV